MANDRELLSLYTLCDNKGRFVYQVVPGYYSGPGLSVEELEYWTCHNIISQAKMNGVRYDAWPLEEVIRLIGEAERKKRKKYESIKKGST